MTTWSYPFTPHSKQKRALQAGAREVLYGGAVAGGKSEVLLAACVDLCTLVPNAKALIVRRSRPELLELHERLRSRLPEFIATFSKQDGIYTFFNGAKLITRYLDSQEDATKVQGFEVQIAAFDELTHYEKSWYSEVVSRLRATGQVKADMDRYGLQLRALSASNPGGRGHAWVKDRFVDPAPMGTEFVGDDGTDRLFIQATLYDNPYIDHEDYIRNSLGPLDPERRRALLEGDWTIPAGVRFPQFRESIHVIKPEDLPIAPVGHARVCGVDFGFNDPYAAVWMAKVHGVIVVYREDQATELTDEQQAQRVLALSDDGDLVHGDDLIVPLDEAAWRRSPKHVGALPDNQAPLGSMARAYMDVLDGKGAQVVKATHGPGSRAHRWATLDRMLAVDETTGLPGILIYDNCRQLIRAIQSAPRDKRKPDDVDTHWKDDHILDALSYGYMELLGRDYHRPLSGHERLRLEGTNRSVTAGVQSVSF